MTEPFLAAAQKKLLKAQAAREERDAENAAKTGEQAGPTRPGFRARRQPTKRQANR